MNRRLFLQTLTAAGLALAAPIAVLEAAPLPPVNPLAGWQFKRVSEEFDMGCSLGICVVARRGSDMFRHAILFAKGQWQQMTSDQKEESWDLLTRMVQERIK